MSVPGIDRPAPAWTGRDDGPGIEHARWHSVVTVVGGEKCTPARNTPGEEPDSVRSAHTCALSTDETHPHPGVALIGFCSDEGVRRNLGRVGAAEGPAAIRRALGSLSAPGRPEIEIPLTDLGDVVVDGEDLEGCHDRLGRAVAAALDAGNLAVVLGGGHEVAYGTYRGVAESHRSEGARHGVFNVDAHFDLRRAERASSGTPFLQMFDDQRAAGKSFSYSVAGISEANNTQVLFDTSAELGVDVLPDHACTPEACDVFVDRFLDTVDVVHLTIDLDAMPAAVAPGVSAPAAFGIGVDVVRRMCRRITASGKLAVVEVAELNPAYDIDAHTARLAARLVDEVVREYASRWSPGDRGSSLQTPG
ncbi:formimidoylglutamase [Mariniluteicoccus flavus]